MSEDITRKTAKNLLWNYAAFGSSKLAVFISSIVLARILGPEEYGLLGLGLLALTILDVLRDFGVSQALIYQQDHPKETADNAFVLGVLSGAALSLIAILAAPAVSAFFSEPRLTPILRVMAFNFFLGSLGNTHMTLLAKQMNFRSRLIPEVGRAFLKAIVSIVLAFSGFGVWSLVWGQLAGTITSNILAWWVTGWVPRLRLQLDIVKGLLSYGVQIALIGVMRVFYNDADYLFIGRRLGSEQLAYYQTAFRLPELVVINLVVMLGQVAFPGYAAMQDDTASLRRAYLTLMRYVALIVMPFSVGMAVIAHDFIILAYTETWAAAIPVMQILSLYALTIALAYNAGDIFKGVGRPGILNQIGLMRLVLIVPLLWVLTPLGITYVALGQLTVSLITTIVTLGILFRVLTIKPLDFWRVIRTPLLAVLVMAGVTLGVQWLMADTFLILRLAATIVSGGLVYVAMLWQFDRATLDEIRRLAQPAKAVG